MPRSHITFIVWFNASKPQNVYCFVPLELEGAKLPLYKVAVYHLITSVGRFELGVMPGSQRPFLLVDLILRSHKAFIVWCHRPFIVWNHRKLPIFWSFIYLDESQDETTWGFHQIDGNWSELYDSTEQWTQHIILGQCWHNVLPASYTMYRH